MTDSLEYERPPFAMLPLAMLRGCTGEQVRLYAALCAYSNGRTGEGAFPALATLAGNLGRSANAVRADLRGLEAAGWLEVWARHRENGSQTSNGYRLRSTPLHSTGGAPYTPREGAPTGSCGPITRPTQPDPPNHLPLASLAPPAAPAATEPEAFAEWWQAYPRKEGKGAARKAYAKALKKTTAAVLLAGAVRYRNDPNREDAYTAHPGPWLNAERWDDEPLPARPVTGSTVSRTQGILERAHERAQAAETGLGQWALEGGDR